MHNWGEKKNAELTIRRNWHYHPLSKPTKLWFYIESGENKKSISQSNWITTLRNLPNIRVTGHKNHVLQSVKVKVSLLKHRSRQSPIIWNSNNCISFNTKLDTPFKPFFPHRRKRTWKILLKYSNQHRVKFRFIRHWNMLILSQ